MKTFVLSFFLCVSIPLAAQFAYPFQNPALTPDERLDNLLSLMTLSEKLHALGTDVGVPRLGIKSTGQMEGLHGMAIGGPMAEGRTPPTQTTQFPQSYGLGETWDVDLILKAADIEATEIRYYSQHPDMRRGGMIMRAPNADLARDPRWGRTEESFGEDPFLVSRMTVAFVKGLQGDNPNYWKSASLMKHFLANSNEDGRDSTSSDFDERLFREYYSYPFYKGITEGGSQAYMASYNSWNGVPMTSNPILEDITRKEWGNKGIICTDGGAFILLMEAHKAYKTYPEGVSAVIKAGVGQFLDTYRPYVLEAMKLGLLTEKDIEKAIRGNFYVALKLGLLDGDQTKIPYTEIGTKDTTYIWNLPEVKNFVRTVTAKSVVLLKNQGNMLPLDKNNIKSIAVVGPRANEVQQDWYSGALFNEVTILQGIRNAVGNNVKINFIPYNSTHNMAEIASQSDIAIVCVGNQVDWRRNRWRQVLSASDGREAVDRRSMMLEQEDIVKVVHQANPNTIMVLVSTFPFAINWSQENVPAILHLADNSQALGDGLADVIFGNVNPAGRTNQTWVRDITDLPPLMDYNIRNGRTYMYFKGKPLYPFGFGLSYTTFAYSGITTNHKEYSPGDAVTVSVKVKNTGKRDGDEVVQIYASYPGSKVERPIKQLKGFKREFIKAGEEKTIDITIAPDELTYWDVDKKQFVVEPGAVNLMVGASSADIRQRTQIKFR